MLEDELLACVVMNWILVRWDVHGIVVIVLEPLKYSEIQCCFLVVWN